MKGFRKLFRQLSSLRKGLEAASRWPDIEQEAFLMNAYLPTYDKKGHFMLVEEADGTLRKIDIDPRKTAQKRVHELYAAVKKHKLSLVKLEKALFQKMEEIATFEEGINVQPLPLPPGVKKDPYHIFYSSTGVKILVGKNAVGNEEVTFKLARGNDLWLHAAHEKGAHVVVALPKDGLCDADTLDYALQLAVKHSQAAKKGEAEVVTSLKKWVKKPPQSAKGQVQVAHPKLYWVKIE